MFPSNSKMAENPYTRESIEKYRKFGINSSGQINAAELMGHVWNEKIGNSYEEFRLELDKLSLHSHKKAVATFDKRAQEIIPIGDFLFAQRGLFGHIEGLAANLGFILGRADLNTEVAAGAVFRGYLDRELGAREFAVFCIDGLEGLGRVLQIGRIIHILPDAGVRAHKGAFAALDAQVGFPNRDFQGDIAFFPFGGGSGVGAVNRKSTHGQAVAFAADDGAQNLAYEFGRFRRDGGSQVGGAGNFSRYLHLMKMGQGLVHSSIVLLNNGFTTLPIGFLDGVFNSRNSFVLG